MATSKETSQPHASEPGNPGGPDKSRAGDRQSRGSTGVEARLSQVNDASDDRLQTPPTRTNSLYAAILAGGVGTRLWPSSRRDSPKQFADLTGAGSSLIQAAAQRMHGLVPPEQLIVVTGEQYTPLVAQQLPFLSDEQIIGEPAGRNTAPAVGLAAVRAQKLNPDAILASLHSDHVIQDTEAFQNALCCAVGVANRGYIVTLGIRPTAAHTGFGYIERGDLLQPVSDCSSDVYAVRRFLEKPDQEVADRFFADGAHYWNAGIFVARVDRFLSEYERQQPELYQALQEIAEIDSSALSRSERDRAFREAWRRVPSISIDHGIMEGADRVAVVPLDAGWNDVGSWDALEDVLPVASEENLVVRGQIVSVDSRNNIVSSDGALIALVGVNNLVVVNTGDAILIGHKHEMQRVREIVDRLAKEGHANLL